MLEIHQNNRIQVINNQNTKKQKSQSNRPKEHAKKCILYLKSDLDDIERRRHRPRDTAGNRTRRSINQRAFELPGLFHRRTKSNFTNVSKPNCKKTHQEPMNPRSKIQEIRQQRNRFSRKTHQESPNPRSKFQEMDSRGRDSQEKLIKNQRILAQNSKKQLAER